MCVYKQYSGTLFNINKIEYSFETGTLTNVYSLLYSFYWSSTVFVLVFPIPLSITLGGKPWWARIFFCSKRTRLPKTLHNVLQFGLNGSIINKIPRIVMWMFENQLIAVSGLWVGLLKVHMRNKTTNCLLINVSFNKILFWIKV